MPNNDSTKPAYELEPVDLITLPGGDFRVLDRTMDDNETVVFVTMVQVGQTRSFPARYPPDERLTVKEEAPTAVPTAVYSRTPADRPRVRKLNRTELKVLRTVAELPADKRTAHEIAKHLEWSPWLVGRIMRRLEALGMVRTGMN